MRTYDRPSIRKKLEQIDANKLNCSSTPDLIECAIADGSLLSQFVEVDVVGDGYMEG